MDNIVTFLNSIIDKAPSSLKNDLDIVKQQIALLISQYDNLEHRCRLYEQQVQDLISDLESAELVIDDFS